MLQLEFKRPQATYVLTCKLTDLGQGPYFSATHEEWEPNKKRIDSNLRSCGAGAERVLQEVNRPDLMPLVRWHLCSLDGGPMHYVANAVYWAEKVAGCSPWPAKSYDPEPLATFKSHVVFGAVEGDEMPELAGLNREGVKNVVTEWCHGRFPALMEAFRADLTKFGVTK